MEVAVYPPMAELGNLKEMLSLFVGALSAAPELLSESEHASKLLQWRQARLFAPLQPLQPSTKGFALPDVHRGSRGQLNREQASQARRLVQERLADRKNIPPTAEQESAKELEMRSMHRLYPLQFDREFGEQAGEALRPLDGSAPTGLIPEWNVMPADGAGKTDGAGHRVPATTMSPAEQRAEVRRQKVATATAAKDLVAEEKAANKTRVTEEKAANKAREMAEKARVTGEAVAEKNRLANEMHEAKAREKQDQGRVDAETRRKFGEEKRADVANAHLEAMATAKAAAAEKLRVRAREKEARVRAAAEERVRAQAERKGLPIPGNDNPSTGEAWPHSGDSGGYKGKQQHRRSAS